MKEIEDLRATKAQLEDLLSVQTMLTQKAESFVGEIENQLSILRDKAAGIVSDEEKWAGILKEFAARDIMDRGTWLWMRNIAKDMGRVEEGECLLNARREAINA